MGFFFFFVRDDLSKEMTVFPLLMDADDAPVIVFLKGEKERDVARVTRSPSSHHHDDLTGAKRLIGLYMYDDKVPSLLFVLYIFI